MCRLEPIAFSPSRSERVRDAALSRRTKVLQRFVGPDELEVRKICRNETMLSTAEAELRKINAVAAPQDKVMCIESCISVILKHLSLSRGSSGSRPGADDLMPVFIYVVLRANVPSLHSNVEYVMAFRDPTHLISRAGYCLTQLQSAMTVSRSPNLCIARAAVASPGTCRHLAALNLTNKNATLRHSSSSIVMPRC